MTDQAKRWTAFGDVVRYDGDGVADCYGSREGKEIATRLAACADLLRGQDDLSAVAVMTWADVEKVREVIRAAMHFAQCKHDSAQWFGMKEAMDLLPVPPKGDCK